MGDAMFPTSLAGLPVWQAANAASATEARLRFVQYVVLEGIAGSPLASALAFKGGNALRFVYQNQRSTIDLDFSSVAGFPDDRDGLRVSLDSAIGPTAKKFGIRVRCQSVTRNPKAVVATFPTYQITLGFAFPGDRLFSNFDTATKAVSSVVDVEISLNEEVCETVERALAIGSNRMLRVCSLEDIVAEKLRSLLQQPIRKRTREQDVLDIATVWAVHAATLDLVHVADYLLRKAAARGVPVSKAAFNDDIRDRAMTDYDQLKRDAGDSFVPFAPAWRTVLGIVAQLNIPAK